MRISADKDYVGYIRQVLSDNPPTTHVDFEDYELRLFTDLGEMRRELQRREEEHSLSRLVAGYAWPWKSKNDKTAYDIELDGQQMRWNTTTTDWINSPKSVEEVGSIHTVQGYDLNYVGVIIGNDLRYDRSQANSSLTATTITIRRARKTTRSSESHIQTKIYFNT